MEFRDVESSTELNSGKDIHYWKILVQNLFFTSTSEVYHYPAILIRRGACSKTDLGRNEF